MNLLELSILLYSIIPMDGHNLNGLQEKPPIAKHGYNSESVQQNNVGMYCIL